MSHRYLFFLEKGKAIVARYEKDIDEMLQCVSNKGEKSFIISDDFWIWWEQVTSYTKEEQVDLCFIYDQDYEILHKDFNQVRYSEWNESLIETFFAQMTNYSNIKLISEKSGELRIENHKRNYTDESEMLFKTNLSFKSRNRDKFIKDSDGEKISILVVFLKKFLEAGNFE